MQVLEVVECLLMICRLLVLAACMAQMVEMLIVLTRCAIMSKIYGLEISFVLIRCTSMSTIPTFRAIRI